jgi:hypothetical protein
MPRGEEYFLRQNTLYPTSVLNSPWLEEKRRIPAQCLGFDYSDDFEVIFTKASDYEIKELDNLTK